MIDPTVIPFVAFEEKSFRALELSKLSNHVDPARRVVGGGRGYSCQLIIVHPDNAIDRTDATIDKITATRFKVPTSL